MADFNLQTLYNFHPPRFMCEHCFGLLTDPVPMPPRGSAGNFRCPVCDAEYAPSKTYSRYDVGNYLEKRGLSLECDNLLLHCTELASATMPPPSGSDRLPMQMLLEALGRAEHFVHVVTYGISEFFSGVLKVLAQKVRVRGIVANADERTLDEFRAHAQEAFLLDVSCYLRGDAWDDFPHQKLIVIDGLLAFTGSANLTLSGWRKAARGKEHVEVVTKVNQVIQLHNRLFARTWVARKVGQARIEMNTLPF